MECGGLSGEHLIPSEAASGALWAECGCVTLATHMQTLSLSAGCQRWPEGGRERDALWLLAFTAKLASNPDARSVIVQPGSVWEEGPERPRESALFLRLTACSWRTEHYPS